jgi:hypothetical protein
MPEDNPPTNMSEEARENLRRYIELAVEVAQRQVDD